MSIEEVFRSIQRLFQLYAMIVSRKKQYLLALPLSTSNGQAPFLDRQDWNKYWDKKNGITGFLFDVISVFYRKFISNSRRPCHNFQFLHFNNQLDKPFIRGFSRLFTIWFFP